MLTLPKLESQYTFRRNSLSICARRLISGDLSQADQADSHSPGPAPGVRGTVNLALPLSTWIGATVDATLLPAGAPVAF